MRIVLDTNIVISGLLWTREPHRILQAIREARVSAFSSRELLIELADVLSRRHLAKNIAAQNTTAEQLVRGYALPAPPVPLGAIEPIVLGDPDDDIVIATALAANADLVVSGDKTVLAVGAYRGVAILTVNDALLRIERL